MREPEYTSEALARLFMLFSLPLLKTMLVEQHHACEDLQEKFELLRRPDFGQSSENSSPKAFTRSGY